jgi:hypothetical protein
MVLPLFHGHLKNPETSPWDKNGSVHDKRADVFFQKVIATKQNKAAFVPGS